MRLGYHVIMDDSKKKNKHAVAMGRAGGKKITEAKSNASRKNGALGGRPKKFNHPELMNKYWEVFKKLATV